jgi:hypothetical protein
VGAVKGEQKIEAIVDVICDMCGGNCWDKSHINLEYSTFRAEWGYLSKRDSIDWVGFYCEGCSEKIKKAIEDLGGKVLEEGAY